MDMSKLLITCEIDDCGQFIWTSCCKLYVTDKINFSIEIISDPQSIFCWDNTIINEFSGLNESEAIEKFKRICINLYTCEGSFSIDEMKDEGNEIRFF